MAQGYALLILAALAFLTSFAFTGFMTIAGLSDVPNARSAHNKITPRGGAIGVIAAFGACCLVLPNLFPTLSMPASLAPFLSLIFAVGVVGLSDDAMTLPAGIKMLALLLICTAAAWIIGPVQSLPSGAGALNLPYVIGLVGSILWLFTVTNITNFMDGANGLMGLCMGIAAFALFGVAVSVSAPISALLSLILAASLLGFLPYNFRQQAKVFAGDVGSLVIGFAYAGIVLMLVQESADISPVYAGPLLILPFLADGLLTMARRAAKGDKLLQAHNQHIYQRLIRSGRRHRHTAWIYGFLTLVMGNLTIFGMQIGWLSSPFILVVPVILLILIYVVASKRLPD